MDTEVKHATEQAAMQALCEQLKTLNETVQAQNNRMDEQQKMLTTYGALLETVAERYNAVVTLANNTVVASNSLVAGFEQMTAAMARLEERSKEAFASRDKQFVESLELLNELSKKVKEHSACLARLLAPKSPRANVN